MVSLGLWRVWCLLCYRVPCVDIVSLPGSGLGSGLGLGFGSVRVRVEVKVEVEVEVEVRFAFSASLTPVTNPLRVTARRVETIVIVSQ